MLSREDNELLCRVGRGRESWIAVTEKARQSDAGVPIAWVPFL